MGEVSQHEAIAKTEHNLTPKRVDLSSKRYHAVFSVCGRLRQLALVSIAAMGLWPLVLQVILVPQSVFGDGHGDRYEQLSYFAFENDHYQSIFENVRAFVVNKTTGGHETMLSVSTEILGLPVEKSVCFGGVDDEGAIQIEALLSAKDSPIFGVDASCLETSDSHLRLRLQSTEFYVPDTMGELNPSRTSGAMLIASLVGANLNPVGSSCYEATRKARNVETQSNSQYLRLVSVYSKQLIVPETCAEFTLYGGKRDQLGCAYSALGTSGAVANLNSDGAQRTYSFPAPWRMIQCSLSGECSSLLFTQMWLSEWTMEKTPIGEVLRQNFVNHKVNEVTVDSTFSIRLVISLQILALVVTAYLTSMHGWYKINCAFVSPWARVMNATTSCTIAKVVRSSYNFILVAQMVLGMIQWRKQLTIDLLVGADTNEAVLRAFGCGTLVVVLAINIVFARAGDLKMQEMEPSFAHVVGFLASIVLFAISRSNTVSASTRTLLATGMTSVSASDVTKYSGCRGSAVCAKEVSLGVYTVVLVIVIAAATFVGLTAHAMLQALVRKTPKVGAATKMSYNVGTSNSETVPPEVNSFTRFLDDRSRSTSLYDCSTEVYVQLSSGDALLSTRAQLEASGFVLASSILFRMLNEVPVGLVADQVIHTHWSKLKGGRLDWMNEYFGGNGETSYRSSRESTRRQSVQKRAET
ncbi:hypothetical protein PC116_g4488 [Phytophthora cactorum]|uniref:Uncharacterized protein n=1 Tax=Phytophthora cactorum TaxID=29920 RepID=A0A8T1EJ25_9STRA|nr:hypothetical protein PC111_g8557 [Phytophthora cactorum]KAG2831173.1 hypothetical protein PC112_g7385 [Phytophthora cactorum]KAG2865784.1 hypothetical protein PC113_g3404 [Phytophthora cactorum]KAG2904254.1 hypothetical protein PC114_g11917 [Phytophthora cactorum]KAG2919379.1 hypothetical protein PC115_g10161 [Phytophthora cactorum]